MATRKSKKTIRIALTNQKGGVGKTTNAFNLAHILANKGYKVLCIDNDPQGNLTRAMLGAKDIGDADIVNAYNEINVKPLSINNNLSFVGANVKLVFVLDKGIKVIFNLAEYLDKVDSKYDFVIIDCLPSLNILLTASLIAATHIIIPTVLDMFSIDGLTNLLSTIESIKKPRFNPELKILGILCNKVRNPKTILASDMEDLIREKYSDLVFENMISDRVALQESPVSSQAITIYSPNHKSAKEFNNVVDEILSRLKTKSKKKQKISHV